MSPWKQFTAAVDANTQKFLQQKRFPREGRRFTWEWHAWNLVVVTVPGFILWSCLHKLEKRMLADQQLREDIQERTGVSSRGYLIPTKKLREEARDMQRHGYKSSQSVDENQGSGNGEVMDLVSQGTISEDSQERIKYHTSGVFQLQASRQQLLERRLEAIERKLGLEENVANSADTTHAEHINNSSSGSLKESSATDDKDANSKLSRTFDIASKATGLTIDLATAAASWVAEVGVPQGIRVVQQARDWLAQDQHEDEGIPMQQDAGGIQEEERSTVSQHQGSREEDRYRGDQKEQR